jgi:hypothetical protein
MGAEWNLFAPAPTTHLMTQVGYNVVLAMYKRMNSTGPLRYVQIMMLWKLTLFFLCRLKINHIYSGPAYRTPRQQ